MKALTCVGDYAKTPYRFDKLGVLVYSMEELCYCLKENAFLLDTDIMNEKLISFIDKECNLQSLARALYPLVHKKGSLSAFVSLILEFVGFYDRTVIAEVEETLKKGSGLSEFERNKMRIDYLAQNHKYDVALREYDSLMEQLGEQAAMPEEKRQELRAGILHNKGVVFAGMMAYEEAGICFAEAFSLNGHKKEICCYLATKRIRMSNSEYISYIAEHPNWYDYSIMLEKEIETLDFLWESSPQSKRLEQLKAKRLAGETVEYNEEIEKIVQALQESYRTGSRE